jgi:hypothetical protein
VDFAADKRFDDSAGECLGLIADTSLPGRG